MKFAYNHPSVYVYFKEVSKILVIENPLNELSHFIFYLKEQKSVEVAVGIPLKE